MTNESKTIILSKEAQFHIGNAIKFRIEIVKRMADAADNSVDRKFYLEELQHLRAVVEELK